MVASRIAGDGERLAVAKRGTTIVPLLIFTENFGRIPEMLWLDLNVAGAVLYRLKGKQGR